MHHTGTVGLASWSSPTDRWPIHCCTLV